MTSCGFRVLDDESQLFEEYGIRVFGYDDVLVGWTPPELYTIQSEAFNLILSHEPCIARQIENSSDNLLLAGHTHGGQVSLPLITARLLPPRLRGIPKRVLHPGRNWDGDCAANVRQQRHRDDPVPVPAVQCAGNCADPAPAGGGMRVHQRDWFPAEGGRSFLFAPPWKKAAAKPEFRSSLF